MVKTISLIQDIQLHDDSLKNMQIDVINHSDIVVFNTNYVYSKYKNYMTHNNVKIIPLGVNFDFFKPISERHPDVLPNSILFIGSSLTYPKGFDRLLKIIEEMKDSNFCLIMKDNFSYDQLPSQLNCRVKIFNRINHETVRIIINSCICAICTSYEETQHLSGIECGACDIPIIASCVGIYNDCQNNEDWGVIADDTNFVEKINYVIKNKDKFNPRDYFIKQGYSIPSCRGAWTSLVNN